MPSSLTHLLYTYSGFVSTTVTLAINTLLYPWASYDGIRLTLDTLVAANVLDLLVLWREHIRRKDYAMLVHHVGVGTAAALARCWCVGSADAYRLQLYPFVWWALTSEISTWFNAVRNIIDRDAYPRASLVAHYVFGVSFLTVRTCSTFGSYCGLVLLRARIREHPNSLVTWTPFWVSSTFWYLLTCINVYWGNQIVRKLRGFPREELVDTSVPVWRRVAFYVGLYAPVWWLVVGGV